MKNIFIFGVFAVVALSCCKESTTPDPQPDPQPEPKGVYLKVEHFFNGSPLTYGSVAWPTIHNNIGVNNLTYYLSAFEFQKQDGEWVKLDNYALITAHEKSTDTVFLGSLPEGTYQAVRFYLGVDSMANHADPALWPNEHPLGLMRAAPMHWSWNTGYIFLKLEGRYRTNNPLDGFYSYHMGRDDLITPYRFTGLQLQGGSNKQFLRLKFDIANFFNTPHAHILSDTSFFTHSAFGDQKAVILHGNMGNLISIQP